MTETVAFALFTAATCAASGWFGFILGRVERADRRLERARAAVDALASSSPERAPPFGGVVMRKFRVVTQGTSREGAYFDVEGPHAYRVSCVPDDPMSLRHFPVGTPCEVIVRPAAEADRAIKRARDKAHA